MTSISSMTNFVLYDRPFTNCSKYWRRQYRDKHTILRIHLYNVSLCVIRREFSAQMIAHNLCPSRFLEAKSRAFAVIAFWSSKWRSVFNCSQETYKLAFGDDGAHRNRRWKSLKEPSGEVLLHQPRSIPAGWRVTWWARVAATGRVAPTIQVYCNYNNGIILIA